MARTQISIKLEADTLRRVDEAAELLGETRTGFIERAVNRALENLEGVIEEMERDSPVTAAILDALASNRKLATAIVRLVEKELSREELEQGLDNYPKLRAEAKRRKGAKKAKHSGRSG